MHSYLFSLRFLVITDFIFKKYTFSRYNRKTFVFSRELFSFTGVKFEADWHIFISSC